MLSLRQELYFIYFYDWLVLWGRDGGSIALCWAHSSAEAEGSLPVPNIPKIGIECYCTVSMFAVTILMQCVPLSKSRHAVEVPGNLLLINSRFELRPERYAHMTLRVVLTFLLVLYPNTSTVRSGSPFPYWVQTFAPAFWYRPRHSI
jgi:hypothetical protein